MPKLSNPTPVRHLAKPDQDLLDAAELAQNNPGEWVELDGLHGASMATQINSGEHAAFPGGAFRATSRTDAETLHEDGKRRVRVWVTYIEG